MKQNYSLYTYTITSSTEVEKIIQSWLTAYHFKPTKDTSKRLYRSSNRYFSYAIADDKLSISAWIKGGFGTTISLEEKFVGILATAPYRDVLAKLFDSLAPFTNNPNYSSSISTTPQNQPSNTRNQDFATFQNDADRRDSNLTYIAFGLSIFGFICSIFTDLVFGVLVYVIIYAFAARGLKTKVKNFAIAAIVITSISILISLIKIAGFIIES